MKIVNISSKDLEAWHDFRRDKITGTRVKDIKPLTRGADRTPAGFWQLVADNIAVAKDGEAERDRGLRLEAEAIAMTCNQFNLNISVEPKVWVSDLDPNIAITPDAYEDSDTPTFAIEVKCLDTKNHIKPVLMDIRARKKDDYKAIDQIPKEYVNQAIQYFVVNEKLEKLYFTFYDDRIALENLVHHVIVIDRSTIESEITEQFEVEVTVLKQVQELIEELKQL